MLPRRLLPVLLLCVACSATRESDGQEEKPRKPPPSPGELPRESALYRTARDVAFAEMIDELREADVVYVGESHDDAAHHRAQLLILEYLAYYGRLHAIGMEMFQRRDQDALDAWVYGEIDEEELLERTGYRERWGYDFALYRPILEFARRRRIPVRALNVADEVRETVREGGLDALSFEQRSGLPALDVSGFPEHRAALRRSYDAHAEFLESPGEEDFERFYLVQVLWDEVMADGIVEWFRTAPDDAQIVVLAGRGHVADRHGIPARVFRRNGRPYRTVVLTTAGAEEGPDRESFAPAFADFLWVTRPAE